jgi:hypothetical protein
LIPELSKSVHQTSDAMRVEGSHEQGYEPAPQLTSIADMRRRFQAEDWVSELFRALGYNVEEQSVFIGGISVDLVVERDGVRSPVEVIFSNRPVNLSRIMEEAARLDSIVQAHGYVSPVIIVFGRVTTAAKHFAAQSHQARIWDISVLRERSKSLPELRKKLAALTEEGEPDGVVTQRGKEERHTKATLIKRVEQHYKYGALSPAEYELLCQEVMTFLFDPHLYGFERQARTSDDANRYDFICRIKSGDPFWDSLRADFRTRSILFECKNYNEPITADQIYSTERYLFTTALRTVCFLMARKGADDGCKRAAQGALRESGKLIVLLSNEDLVEMLKLKEETGGPTSYLDEKIWKFIITLPR